MKNTIAFITFALLSFILNDLNAQCDPVREVLRNDTRKSFFTNNGMISNEDPSDVNGFFENGDTQLFTLGYAKSLWMAGFDPAGNLKLAANTYPNGSADDFIPGPLDRSTGQALDDACSFFNRIWKVSAFQVNQVRSQWDDGSITADGIPADILEWPGFGNPHIDFTIDFSFAPFFDQDNDGIYDPLNGDYPIPISENPIFIPFEFSFCVYNDVTPHTSTQGAPLQMEVQQINYLINCEDRPSGKTVFTRLRYVYLGQETLSNVRISVWEDNDLGCFNNDFQGCNQDLNCVYYYNKNGETSADSQCFGNIAVPEDNGAVRTTVFFNRTMESHIYFTNGVVGTSPPAIAGPELPIEYYNFMDAKWRDGTPVSDNGIGYDPSATNSTNFIFPDLPNDPNGWSMQSEGLESVFDYRAVTTLNSNDLQPGDINIIDIGDYMLYDPNQKKLAIFDNWADRVAELKEDYDGIVSGAYDCGFEIIPCEVDCVWPGDVNRDGIVNGIDVVYDGALIQQNISGGLSREIIASDWFPFESADWGGMIQSVNHKNGDVNGNGKINANDINLLLRNFNETNPSNSFTLQRATLPDDFGLSMTYNKQEVSAAETTVFRTFKVDVQLGNDAGEITAPLHGISYIMRYDTNLVVPFSEVDSPPLQEFAFKFAYMHNAETNANDEVVGDNNIQYAFSNLINGDRQFGGRISDQTMIVKENAKTSNLDGRDTLVMSFYNIFAMNSDGEVLDVGIHYDSLIITDLEVDPDLISSNQTISAFDFSLYPNPVEDNLTIGFNSCFSNDCSGELTILNSEGKLLDRYSINQDSKISIPTRAYLPGIYFVRLENAKGESTINKFIKL